MFKTLTTGGIFIYLSILDTMINFLLNLNWPIFWIILALNYFHWRCHSISITNNNYIVTTHRSIFVTKLSVKSKRLTLINYWVRLRDYKEAQVLEILVKADNSFMAFTLSLWMYLCCFSIPIIMKYINDFMFELV